MTMTRTATAPRTPPGAGLLSAVLLSLTVSCSEAGPATSSAGYEVVDSAGVEIVLNASGEADGQRLEIVEDLRLGSVDGAREELLFHGVYALLVDANGTIYVGNNQTATVRVFAEDGTFVREFGGRGEGPSEIPHMLNDLLWAGDRIAVIDWQSGGKTVVFDTTGEFSESWRNIRPDGTQLTVGGYTPRGWIAAESDFSRPTDVVPGRPYPQNIRLRYVAGDGDSLGGVFVELPPRILYGSPATEGLDWALFEPATVSGFDGAGNYYRSAGEEYRIDIWNPDGRLIRSVRREHDPIPITRDDIDALKERVRIRYDTASRYDDARRRQAIERSMERIENQASFPRPQTRPPLGRMLVATSGAVWVERSDFREPAEEWLERRYGMFDRMAEVETSWDLLSPEGRFLGNVILPPRFNPMAVTEHAVVGVVKDELDVEYVVRYRVTGSLPE